jgi:cytochrome c6
VAEESNVMQCKQTVRYFLAIALFFVSTLSFPALSFAADVPNGAQIFEMQCAGCHINGGNIVRRGKDLKLGTLKKNGVDSVEAIATLVSNGKGNMSAYGDRLTPEEIAAVSAYVLEQAQQNWRS